MRFLLIFYYSTIFVLAYARRIVYPNVADEFPTNCNLTDGTTGICRKQCATYTTQTIDTEYKVCYFLGGAVYHCCRESASAATAAPLQERTAERACAIPVRHEIVLGQATKPKEFPYMAALGWRHPFISNQYDYKCGGVVIWFNFLLTAAHCAIVNGIEPDVVLLGGVNLTDTTEPVLQIKRIIIHPDYNSDLVYNDIALLEFELQGANLKLACPWTRTTLDNNNLVAIGYGHINFGGVGSDQLLKANFNIIPNAECQNFYEKDDTMPRGILNTQLCAKDPAKRSDTCQGDSGGPLIMYTRVRGQNRAQVVGITSFGAGCALSPPGIYTRVAAYVDWIEQTVWPNGCNC